MLTLSRKEDPPIEDRRNRTIKDDSSNEQKPSTVNHGVDGRSDKNGYDTDQVKLDGPMSSI